MNVMLKLLKQEAVQIEKKTEFDIARFNKSYRKIKRSSRSKPC